MRSFRFALLSLFFCAVLVAQDAGIPNFKDSQTLLDKRISSEFSENSDTVVSDTVVSDSVVSDSVVSDSVVSDSVVSDTVVSDSVVSDSVVSDSVVSDSVVSDSVVSDSVVSDSVVSDSVVSDSVVSDSVVSDSVVSDSVVSDTVVSDTVVALKAEKRVEGSAARVVVPLLLITVLLIIIVLIVRRISKGRDSDKFLTSTRISIMDREVQLVCRYIEDHYADPSLTMKKVCEDLSTGEQFVETLFVKELDMTPDAFITHVRIHHAVNRINDGFEEDEQELMLLCGYSDRSRFQHDFYTVTGVQVSSLLNQFS